MQYNGETDVSFVLVRSSSLIVPEVVILPTAGVAFGGGFVPVMGLPRRCRLCVIVFIHLILS